MNQPKRYIVKCGGQVYRCPSKPDLNTVLSKIASGIGKIYGNIITVDIELEK